MLEMEERWIEEKDVGSRLLKVVALRPWDEQS